MGMLGSPDMSVWNYHSTLCKIPYLDAEMLKKCCAFMQAEGSLLCLLLDPTLSVSS